MDHNISASEVEQKISIWHTVIVGTFFMLAFYPVWKSLINTWSNSEDYSHAFFIVPISIYLIWSKKKELSQLPVSFSRSGLVLFILSLLLYLLAFYAKIATVLSFSMVLTIIAIVLTFYGTKVTRAILFPLFFLFLMIPVPAQIFSAATIPLQLFVSEISTMIARLFEIPIFREGNIINLPDRTLQVVDACSGLRSIISLFTLSLLFGYMTLSSNINRGLLALASIPVALFVNIIRVLAMIMAFYYFDLDLTTDTVHTYFGLLIFALAFLILYAIAKCFSYIERKVSI